MASVLSAVNERRLRPIYEQLDSGNNKKALTEAEKVLKKQKDLTAAKVLKTIALHRLGKDKEAFALSEEIANSQPTDENSLQGLSLYYKEIRKTDLICSLYEAAVKHCPGNEEYLTHLFMSYVRHNNYHLMQKVAMNLYKYHPKNPYFFWGIMAIVLQGKYAADKKLANSMYLPLALKMIEKHIENGKIEAEAEVRLYLLILELMGKHEKIIEVLRGPLGDKLTSELRAKEVIMFFALERSELWSDVNRQYKKLLKESPDVWNFALGYLNSFFKLNSISTANGERENNEEESKENRSIEQSDFHLSHAFQFILSLVKAENALVEKKRRGPYLLRLEMLRCLKEMGDDSQEEITRLGSPWQLLLEYALDFSTKPCCFHDLAPYFVLLPDKDVDKFLADLYEQQASFTYNEINGDTVSPDLIAEVNRRKEKELQRHIFTMEATRFLGKHESLFNEEKLALAADYVRRHKEGVRYSSDRPATDGRVADSYCLFAVRLILDVYQDTEDIALLWACVHVLERGLVQSEYNHEMKLMLMRIYCKVALFKPCRRLFDSLEVKHIQHETIGYTVSHHVLSLGHYDIGALLFHLAKNFYASSDKECVECLISCFRNGTFHKVSEFIDFRKKINDSFHAVHVKTEHSLLQLFVQANIDRCPPLSHFLPTINTTRIDYDCLTDNRDFTVITDINPENKRLTTELIEESFAEGKRWLRFRELLLLCLRAVLSYPEQMASSRNGFKSGKDAFKEIDELLNEFETVCETPPGESPAYPFHGPHPSRMHLYFEAKYPQSIIMLLKYCRNVYANTDREGNSASDSPPSLASVIANMNDFLQTCSDGIVMEQRCDDGAEEDDNMAAILSESIPDVLLSMRPSAVERLAVCVELFSFAALLLTNMQSLVGEVKSDLLRRRKKKKKQPTVDSPQCGWLTGYHESVTSLHDLGGKLTDAIQRLKTDADRMLRDVAKSHLTESELNKRRTLSDIPEIPHAAAETATEQSASGDKAVLTSKPNDSDDVSIKNEVSQSESRDSSEPIAADSLDDVGKVMEGLKKATIDEVASSCSSSPFPNHLDCDSSDVLFDKIVRGASESIQTSYEEMSSVVSGRNDNLMI